MVIKKNKLSYWLTDKSPLVQDIIPNKLKTLNNQLLVVGDRIYLIPRNTLTDGYTIPFDIDKTKYDIRGASLHDIGCFYHQVIRVKLPEEEIRNNYLYIEDTKVRCKDIPPKYLYIDDISFKECNDLLYYGMRASGIPSAICKLYRLAVNFNIHWLLTGIDTISKYNLYDNTLTT